MAEFALGLTKTAVEGTLSRVKSAIEEEAKLKERVQNDLVFIIGEFQMMQSFLNVASKERAKNEVVRTWVRQLRDLAFDVEDCIEFVVHLEKKSSWWWRVVPSCLAPPRHLDEAVSEIKQLKARVEDVSQRNTRYNLISDSGSHSKTVTQVEQPAPATANPSSFHILRQVWEAAGKIRNKGDLKELITRESRDLQVISVWGNTIGDLGMTSILRKVYCDPMICQKFKIRAWVKVMHPFNPDEFLKSLLTQLYVSTHQANEGVDDLNKAELMQQVKEQRYLVVLEEVSTVAEWNAIKMYLPDSCNGSRIIMSTQDFGIALLCTGEPYLLSELRRLSDGQSLYAFFKKVPGSRSDMGELKWQISRRGVVSVHGSSPSKSVVIKNLYRSIMYKREEFDGLKFGTYRWVNVSDPFNRMDFARRLLVGSDDSDSDDEDDSDNLQANEIAAVDMTGDQNLIEDCCLFLREGGYLIVIDGLRSTEDWTWIKATFLSQPIEGCLVVITDNESVGKHCVDDEDRALNSQVVVAEGSHWTSRRDEARDWTNNFQLVGHQSEAAELIDQIWNSIPGVFSVWGIAGVGKSALVRNYYYRRILRLRQEHEIPDDGGTISYRLLKKFAAAYSYSWVDVPHPFNLTDFSRRLLMDFHSDDLLATETAAVGIMEGQAPIQGCCSFLREHTCLVVIDGLRHKDDWDLIKAAILSEPTNKRNNIIVITDEASVARYCVDNNEGRVSNVKGLEADAVLNLFKKIAWGDKQLTRDELEHSKLVMAKCGGLPEIITAIAKYCYSSIYRLRAINDHFMDSLETNVTEEFHSLRGLFSWMQSYFDACSDSLKPCIFYLSVFSADHNIRRRRLMMRWIAEGYSRDTFSGTAEKNGERLFSELVDLSIIWQPSSKILYQVNGFFREYIMSRPMEDNLVFALEGHCTLSSHRTGQHITIGSSWDRDKIVYESIDFSRVRSLTVFGEWRSFFISTHTNMKLVRVLDLEDTLGVTDDDIEQIGKMLPRLKFLSLRGCRDITHLPNSLSGLRQLQTLDIRHTSIATLPKAIIKLQKLQYIRAGTTEPWDDSRGSSEPPTSVVRASTPSRSRPHTLVSKLCCKCRLGHGGVEVPAGIGNLTALNTFGVVNVSGAGGKAILKELNKFTQLRKLGVSGINRENIHELCSAISGHNHLESLSVRLDKDKDGLFVCFDDISEPHRTLKSLKLYGHVHKLPVWIKRLGNLEKLDLEMTILTQDDTHFLAELPCRNVLRRLCVKPTQDGELHIGTPDDCPSLFFDDDFRLRVLEIVCTSRLQVIFGHDDIAYGVEVLKVRCSSGSSLRFSGLRYLRQLKEVWLTGSYGDALKQDMQRQLAEHEKKPVFVGQNERA